MIWVAMYHTESGDRGVLGYFNREPSEGQLTAVFKENMPDEFVQETDGAEYRLVFWEVVELDKLKLPKAIPEVETI